MNIRNVSSLTLLQAIYWQTQELYDAAWKLDNRISGFKRRGRNAPTLIAQHTSILGQIDTNVAQMALLEA